MKKWQKYCINPNTYIGPVLCTIIINFVVNFYLWPLGPAHWPPCKASRFSIYRSPKVWRTKWRITKLNISLNQKIEAFWSKTYPPDPTSSNVSSAISALSKKFSILFLFLSKRAKKMRKVTNIDPILSHFFHISNMSVLPSVWSYRLFFCAEKLWFINDYVSISRVLSPFLVTFWRKTLFG